MNTISIEERRALLGQRLAQMTLGGGRIESQTAEMAVIVYGKPVNHILHFLLGFPTLGIWWFTIWPLMVITGGEKRQMVTVDEFGNVLVTKTAR